MCYVGLVYKRSELTSDKRHACCAAQMFLADGEGVVFRGALGPWFQTDTKQFHLDEDAAKSLIEMVVGEYIRLHDGPPRELFIHAKSAFTDSEWKGFLAGCGKSTNLVGVQIAEARDDLKSFGRALPGCQRNCAAGWRAARVPVDGGLRAAARHLYGA